MESSATSEMRSKGQQLYAAGDYQGAKDAYRAWADAVPTSDEAWRMLGFAQYALQGFDDALASFTKACGLKPDSPENQFGLGLAATATYDLDRAVTALDEAVRLKSDHLHAKAALVDVLMRRSQTYFGQNNLQYGEHDLDRAAKLDRKNPVPVLAFIRHLVDSGQHQRATKTAQQALMDLPNDPQVRVAAEQLGISTVGSALVQAQRREQVRQSQEVPCPVCKKMVMNWASVCPYCNSVIKQIPSQFAGRDTGPRFTWQEIAYKIMAGLWILYGGFVLFVGLRLMSMDLGMPGFEAPFVIFGVVAMGIGIGLFTENEVVQFIAKVFCLLTFCSIGCGFVFMGGLMMRGGFVIGTLLSIVFAAFQLYLLKEVGD